MRLAVTLLLAYFLAFHAPNAATRAEETERGPGAIEPNSPAEWYGAAIRPTEARTPADELSGFHLPPGFKIELFASEPEIAKPLNMALDVRGRLWVSDTVEYPYPAPEGQEPRDTIKVLEDTDGDHRADRVTLFADKLNVPIGVLPYGDGVIAFSIPNLYYLRDTDGDGRCDKREIILGPFDYSRDTHGMVNSLRMDFDGWIYACHGFNNQSSISGRDGWQVEMHSGNTFRFRPDGERVEHFTHGQVNPFGMTCDDWGQWFTADCHSKPITQLLRGGYYSSFGRPDDGLGLVPSMMEHLHGSTAISGIVLHQGDGFPAGYGNQFYSGNVMTSRINRNALTRIGATYQAKELGDFLTSDDPWFRPVDLQVASDGSIFVADFYNRIIGHYEVPLDHPGRDRERGRIWRISAAKEFPLLLSGVESRHVSTRLAAMQQLVLEAETPSEAHFSSGYEPERLWVLHRRGELSSSDLIRGIDSLDPRTRAHALRIAGEWKAWNETLRGAVTKAIDDPDARVAQAACEAWGRNPNPDGISRLLNRLRTVELGDSILRQTIRIAVRDSLLQTDILTLAKVDELIDSDKDDALISILLGLKTEASATCLARYLARSSKSLVADTPYAKHALRFASEAIASDLVSTLRTRLEAEPNTNASLKSTSDWLVLIAQSRRSTAFDGGAPAREWASQWCQARWNDSILNRVTHPPDYVEWRSIPQATPWPTQNRASEDGVTRGYRSSFPLGETYTGTLRSSAFNAPTSLSFWIVGHDGFPTAQAPGNNFVQLVDAERDVVLRRAEVPRADTAKRVDWDLADLQGRLVAIEAVDRDAGAAYAWLAFGQFDLATLNASADDVELEAWLAVVNAYQLTEFAATIQQTLAASNHVSLAAKLKLLKTTSHLRSDANATLILEAIETLPHPERTLSRVAPVILDGRAHALDAEWIKDAAATLPLDRQIQLSQSLAKHRQGVEWLVTAASEGWVSGEVLRSKDVASALEVLGSESVQESAHRIVSELPNIDEQLNQLVAQRFASFTTQSGDPHLGAAAFTKHCASCHQIAGAGSLVGPQLDGVGGRGVARLLEDILQPDRNVDKAFRTTSFLLDDGSVIVGLLRAESGSELEVVGNDGKSRTIETARVEERQSMARSLMPTGLADSIGNETFNHLLAYLLTQTAQNQPPAQTP